MLKSFPKFVFHFFIVVVLTLTTQVGGIIFLICKIALKSKRVRLNFFSKLLIFIGIYTVLTFTIIPFLATKMGRVPLPYFSSKEIPLKPLNFAFCLLNRNYVKPELRKVLIVTAQKMNQKHPNTITCYLDTSFPFWDKFPLLPHLSHYDGKKADLAFCYKDAVSGEEIEGNAPAWLGYGIFEEPQKGEVNKTADCQKKGHWQYDYPKYIGFSFTKKMKLDEVRTKSLLDFLAESPQIRMILIETHLKNRLRLSSGKIRFQGCHSVRHDDHIHLQL